MSTTEYKIFVMQASEAGQEIEDQYNNSLSKEQINCWNWWEYSYIIKLPEGWEYVIEDGEIAFREPKKGEMFLNSKYHVKYESWGADFKRPIIKRIKA